MSTPEGGDHLHRAKPVSGSTEPARWSASSGQQERTATTRLSGPMARSKEGGHHLKVMPVVPGEPAMADMAVSKEGGHHPPRAGRVTMVRLRPVVCETVRRGAVMPVVPGDTKMEESRELKSSREATPMPAKPPPRGSDHGSPADSTRKAHDVQKTRQVHTGGAPSEDVPADSTRLGSRLAEDPTMKVPERTATTRLSGHGIGACRYTFLANGSGEPKSSREATPEPAKPPPRF